MLTIQKCRHKTLKLARWVHSNPGGGGGVGGDGGLLYQYLGTGEPLAFENLTLNFITLFRTKDKMSAVLF